MIRRGDIMKNANIKTVSENIFTAVYLIILTALAVFTVYLHNNERDIYFAGCIFRRSVISLIIPFLTALYTCVFMSIKRLGKEEDTEKRSSIKRYLTVSSVFCLFMFGFIVFDISDSYINGRNDILREISIDGDKSIILRETSETMAGTDNSYNAIYVYRRYGAAVQNLGRINENYYSNDPLIANELYKWEYDGDTFTLYLDYGDLCSGLKWQDDAEPPEYIVKEYTL